MAQFVVCQTYDQEVEGSNLCWHGVVSLEQDMLSSLLDTGLAQENILTL